MIRLLKNAISKCSAQMTSSVGIDRFYYNQAPATVVSGSYVVYYLLDNNREGSDSGTNYSTSHVQFNCFSVNDNNGDNCDNIATEIKRIFKTSNLTVSGSTVIDVMYDRTFPSKLVDKCWQSTVLFRVHTLNQTK